MFAFSKYLLSGDFKYYLLTFTNAPTISVTIEAETPMSQVSGSIFRTYTVSYKVGDSKSTCELDCFMGCTRGAKVNAKVDRQRNICRSEIGSSHWAGAVFILIALFFFAVIPVWLVVPGQNPKIDP